MDLATVLPPPEVAARTFKVLIVDDEETTRLLLTSMIRPMHHSVRTAANGLDAWAIVQAEHPDLVVVDWLMPQMDGLELCARIRQSRGDECFVMLVTARHGADDLTAALAAGADDYIVKPVNRRDFQARVAIAERRVALARAKNAAVEEATRMRWLAGIGQTVLALQHEINNPLAALFGLLGELSVENGLPPSLEGDVRSAWEQTHRIAGVVERLSKMNAPTTVELVPGLTMLAVPTAAARSMVAQAGAPAA